MLPVHRGSFFGPVYQFVAMLASLAMPLFFITGWMLYLKRRKQKKLTQAARQSLAGHYIDQNAKPWLITYATQTGLRNNSRGVRQRAYKRRINQFRLNLYNN